MTFRLREVMALVKGYLHPTSPQSILLNIRQIIVVNSLSLYVAITLLSKLTEIVLAGSDHVHCVITYTPGMKLTEDKRRELFFLIFRRPLTINHKVNERRGIQY